MLRKWMPIVVTVVLLVLLSGCASTPSARRVTATEPLSAPDSTNSDGAYEGATEYRLGAQDLIEVSVFGVKDLNQVVRVNSNGQISLPLVGTIKAGGQTIPELEADLAKRYAAGFVRNPQVTVFVKEFSSQRFTMEGAVVKPGIYPLTGKLSLLQAMAMAGGLQPLADPNGVVLFRQINGKKMAAVYSMSELRSGRIADPPLYGDDIIVVEESSSKTAVRRFMEAIPVLGFFMLF